MIESANLKGAAAKGLFWSAMDRFGGQGIQFVFGILITRILLPADYGLVGMILIFGRLVKRWLTAVLDRR
jgi:O-antigen/teichoic acid export membrane protein